MLLAVVLVGGGWAYFHHSSAPAAAFRLAPIKRGDLQATISATGTVEPEEVVDVGAQVAGQILSFGPDPSNPGKTIDYGSEVNVGDVLANIDDSLYAADVDSAKGALEEAQANVVKANADVGQMQAKLDNTQRDWNRAQKAGLQVISETSYDAYESAYLEARAQLAVGQATIAQMEKQLLQAQAALKRAQTNLEYCTIRSPVKGTIIDRRVNIGQTVVSSLNAPSLFLIAKDLKRIQVWASVNEADIGNIHPGQEATFTVDAFPNVTFKGVVNKVRLNATMTQNVVTYTVEVATDNSDGKLLPYLTANVDFLIGRRNNVLQAPNAALRWFPGLQQVAPDVRDQVAADMKKRTDAIAGADAAGSASATDNPAQNQGQLWTPDGAFVRPVDVTVGLTDGSNTEVSGDKLAEGMTVIIGEQQTATAADSVNPFTPQFGKKQ